jgi:riboflavin synthase
MFSGIVAERGRLSAAPAPAGAGIRLAIGHSAALAARLAIGDSLAVAGVCLTVVQTGGRESAVELSPETLARTTLGRLRRGDAVNLEPALRVGDALGGHWVLGHVDGTVAVRERRDEGEFRVLACELPPGFARWVVEKGSLALDGVSLTVAALARDRFEVALIPHTLEVTTLADLEVGDRVNFEADVLAKYVERAVAAHGRGPRVGQPGDGGP